MEGNDEFAQYERRQCRAVDRDEVEHRINDRVVMLLLSISTQGDIYSPCIYPINRNVSASRR